MKHSDPWPPDSQKYSLKSRKMFQLDKVKNINASVVEKTLFERSG